MLTTNIKVSIIIPVYNVEKYLPFCIESCINQTLKELEIILVNDDDSINMARKIALDLGIGVGISSGANMIASVLAKAKNTKDIVTVFPDDNKKYLTTDLSNPVDNNSRFISNEIELLDYEFI